VGVSFAVMKTIALPLLLAVGSLLGPHAAGRAAAPSTPPALAKKAEPAAPAPHLQFDATAIDLGDVVRGKDASAVFTYRNTGEGVLKILSAKPG
jgi:hypothetical protein